MKSAGSPTHQPGMNTPKTTKFVFVFPLSGFAGVCVVAGEPGLVPWAFGLVICLAVLEQGPAVMSIAASLATQLAWSTAMTWAPSRSSSMSSRVRPGSGGGSSGGGGSQ